MQDRRAVKLEGGVIMIFDIQTLIHAVGQLLISPTTHTACDSTPSHIRDQVAQRAQLMEKDSLLIADLW